MPSSRRPITSRSPSPSVTRIELDASGPQITTTACSAEGTNSPGRAALAAGSLRTWHGSAPIRQLQAKPDLLAKAKDVAVAQLALAHPPCVDRHPVGAVQVADVKAIRQQRRQRDMTP